MTDPPSLYTAAGCDESPQVRAWFVERGITSIERHVTDDPDTAAALYRTGTFATPLLVVARQTVLGFRPDEIAAALSDPT